MRCKACNKILQEEDIRDNPKTGQLEDLCLECKGISLAAALGIENDEDHVDLGHIADAIDANKDTWD